MGCPVFSWLLGFYCFTRFFKFNFKKIRGMDYEEIRQDIKAMTTLKQYKLIAREPTEEMLDAQYADAGIGRDLARKCFMQMFDAAPDIEEDKPLDMPLYLRKFPDIESEAVVDKAAEDACERVLKKQSIKPESEAEKKAQSCLLNPLWYSRAEMKEIIHALLAERGIK